jgi:hypothetical protein
VSWAFYAVLSKSDSRAILLMGTGGEPACGGAHYCSLRPRAGKRYNTPRTADAEAER